MFRVFLVFDVWDLVFLIQDIVALFFTELFPFGSRGSALVTPPAATLHDN